VSSLTRRRLLSSAPLALAAACRRNKAEGFPGYAFIANAAGGAVAVVDLGAFAAVRHIRLDANPSDLASHPKRPSVYALTPASGCVHELDADSLSLARTVGCSSEAERFQLTRDGESLWLLARKEGCLTRIRTADLAPAGRISLPGPAVSFDLSPDAALAAVALRAGAVAIVELASGQIASAAVQGSADDVRFRSDGRQVLCANRARSILSILDADAVEWVVHLPLSVVPENLCFKPDGGQLFLTGGGSDAVVTVHPFETQVASTTLAGRSPGPMAASEDPGYLFITNPAAGDVTVLDIASQRVAAVVPAGGYPHFVAVTPDSRYALVLNRDSGDVAVIRVESLTGRRRRAAPLFMMVPVGSRPERAVIRTV
jgi:YVTN family beta-propeller protein